MQTCTFSGQTQKTPNIRSDSEKFAEYSLYSLDKSEFSVYNNSNHIMGGDGMKFETENIEFKAQVTDELYKEVIAFANTDGGTIYIGIDNEGNVTELDNVDEVYTRITNGIRDAILPDVTMFVKYTLGENHTIRIKVSEICEIKR